MPHTSASTKVIGYFVPERSDHLIGEIDWTALSHVNIIGISPDTDGNWALGGGREAGVLIPLIKNKNPDIRILATVAGAADIYEDWIEQLNGKSRSTLIAGLMLYLGNSGYDGVDIDLENGAVTPSWEEFILETQAAAKKENLIFTGALAGWDQPNSTRRGAEAFDWINIMSYDEKGPGQHSSIHGTEKAFNYFNLNGRGIPGHRLAIGIPTYGYWFENGEAAAGGEFDYASVVNKNPANADVDQFTENGRTYYYNGRPTVREKVRMAKERNAHIMIFRIGIDAFNEYSIIKEIENSLNDPGREALTSGDAST